MAINRETLDNLYAWHWEFGAHRTGRFNLPSDWVVNLSDIDEGRVPSRNHQREILFWGQASAYSHVYLNNAFGDCLGGYGSEESKLYKGVGADQSGIAMRFTSSETMPESADKLIGVNLSTMSDILLAISLGYFAHKADLTPVNATTVESLVESDSNTTGADSEASELLAATMNTVSCLVSSGHKRFKHLISDNVWDKQLGSLAVRNPDFRKRPKSIENFLATLLWDQNEETTNFLNSLRRVRTPLMTKLAGRPLYVTQDMMKLIVSSDDKFITLDSRIDRRKPKDAQEFAAKIRAVELVEYNDYCVLKLGTAPVDFFSNETDFTLFVGLIKELVQSVTPDNSGELDHATASYFNAYDIVDLPKPGFDFSSFDHGRIWALDEPRGDSGMCRRLLKRGKAEAALFFKSPEFSTCVYVSAPDFPDSLPQTGPAIIDKLTSVQVIAGIDAVLADETIIFKDVLQRVLQLGGGSVVRQPIVGIAIGDVNFLELDPMEQDKAADNAANAPGFKALFPDAEAEKALFAALVRDDGGMGFALESLTAKFARQASAQHGRQVFAEDALNQLVKQALPQSAFSGTDHRDAFVALADAIEAFCMEPEKLADKRASVVTISESLREAFSLRTEDLDAVPRSLGSDHGSASTYVGDQLKHWAAHSSLNSLFDLVNLAPYHREEVLKSIQALVPVDEVGIWLTQEFGEIGANREALHCRRYVATRLSKEIFDLSEVRIASVSDDHLVLQEQLDIWARPTANLEDSLHYQVVVSPMVTRLRQIAEIIPKTIWVKQPGDEEIRLIAQSLNITG